VITDPSRGDIADVRLRRRNSRRSSLSISRRNWSKPLRRAATTDFPRLGNRRSTGPGHRRMARWPRPRPGPQGRPFPDLPCGMRKVEGADPPCRRPEDRRHEPLVTRVLLGALPPALASPTGPPQPSSAGGKPRPRDKPASFWSLLPHHRPGNRCPHSHSKARLRNAAVVIRMLLAVVDEFIRAPWRLRHGGSWSRRRLIRSLSGACRFVFANESVAFRPDIQRGRHLQQDGSAVWGDAYHGSFSAGLLHAVGIPTTTGQVNRRLPWFRRRPSRRLALPRFGEHTHPHSP
jgi:hypothetical protein